MIDSIPGRTTTHIAHNPMSHFMKEDVVVIIVEILSRTIYNYPRIICRCTRYCSRCATYDQLPTRMASYRLIF